MNCSFIIGKFSQGKSTNLSVHIKLHNLKKNLNLDLQQLYKYKIVLKNIHDK